MNEYKKWRLWTVKSNVLRMLNPFSPQWATMLRKRCLAALNVFAFPPGVFPQLFFHLSYWRDGDASSALCHRAAPSTDSFAIFIFIQWTFSQYVSTNWTRSKLWREAPDLNPPTKTWKHKELKTVVPTAKKWFIRGRLEGWKVIKTVPDCLNINSFFFFFFWKTLFFWHKNNSDQTHLSPGLPLGLSTISSSHFSHFITLIHSSTW